MEGDPLGKQLAMALKSVQAQLDERLTAVGSSFSTYLVLRYIQQHPGLSQRALAERLGIEGPTLTHHLDRLSERGLVDRVRHTGDRRVSSAVLTAPGRAHLQKARAIADRYNAELQGLFGADELATLTACLGRIADRYGRYPFDRNRSA